MALKKNLTVPQTQNILAPYMALFMATYDGTKSFTDADILSVKMTEVGKIASFNYDNKRVGGGHYRTFNRNNPGAITETYPGIPDYDLTLSTVLLHVGSLVEALGYGLADIGNMDAPLIIQLQIIAPGTLPERTWTFKDCWIIDGNIFKFDAEPTDLKLIQTMKIETAGVIEGQSAV